MRAKDFVIAVTLLLIGTPPLARPAQPTADVVDDSWVGECQNMTGAIFQRSRVTMAAIRDGTPNTYLVGEKSLNTDMYATGQNWGDNGSAYTGHDKDNARYATAIYLPVPDTDGGGEPGFRCFNFGSAHSGGWNVCLCDGSVRSIGYWIDPLIHACLGNRDDGEPIDGSKL